MRRYRRGRQTGRRSGGRIILLILFLAAIGIGLYFLLRGGLGGLFAGRSTPTPSASPTPAATPAPTPMAHSSALPENFGLTSDLNLDGADIASYTRTSPLIFGDGSSYTALPGILTFRGDNYRQGATYGKANVQAKTLTLEWTQDTASLPRTSGTNSWSGNGWTGQPLIIQWPAETRRIMNLNDAAREKDGLIEVIYPSLDGFVHFIDLEAGTRTRNKLDIGAPFKGAGSLDPRGYPLLYLGGGDEVPPHHGRPAVLQEYYIYSLIDGQRLYSFGKSPDPFAQRAWHAYDASALVHAATDTLIEPGENGILYTMKLNTQFDQSAGTISIAPSDILKFRYTTTRARDGMANDTYWLGMEASPVMWGQWLYVSDNCGTMLCIDTTTMRVVWAQDTLDDSNSTPVLDLENGHPYIYTSTSLHWTQDANARGTIPIWKMDGLTGEIIWRRDYNCSTQDGVSGGVEGTGLLGQGAMQDIVIYPMARTPNHNTGQLVALNKSDGSDAWVFDMQNYAWSSPVAIYGEDGSAYVIICDSAGNMHLLDGQNGTLLDSINLGSNIEASPAVYGNMIVVGTRQQLICGVRIN